MVGFNEKMKQMTEYNSKLTEEIRHLLQENSTLQQKAKNNGLLTHAEVEELLDDFQR